MSSALVAQIVIAVIGAVGVYLAARMARRGTAESARLKHDADVLDATIQAQDTLNKNLVEELVRKGGDLERARAWANEAQAGWDTCRHEMSRLDSDLREIRAYVLEQVERAARKVDPNVNLEEML